MKRKKEKETNKQRKKDRKEKLVPEARLTCTAPSGGNHDKQQEAQLGHGGLEKIKMKVTFYSDLLFPLFLSQLLASFKYLKATSWFLTQHLLALPVT